METLPTEIKMLIGNYSVPKIYIVEIFIAMNTPFRYMYIGDLVNMTHDLLMNNCLPLDDMSTTIPISGINGQIAMLVKLEVKLWDFIKDKDDIDVNVREGLKPNLVRLVNYGKVSKEELHKWFVENVYRYNITPVQLITGNFYKLYAA